MKGNDDDDDDENDNENKNDNNKTGIQKLVSLSLSLSLSFFHGVTTISYTTGLCYLEGDAISPSQETTVSQDQTVISQSKS